METKLWSTGAPHLSHGPLLTLHRAGAQHLLQADSLKNSAVLFCFEVMKQLNSQQVLDSGEVCHSFCQLLHKNPDQCKMSNLKIETAISLSLINHSQFDFIFLHWLSSNKGKFLKWPKLSRMFLSPQDRTSKIHLSLLLGLTKMSPKLQQI